jgi:hypothetical protein
VKALWSEPEILEFRAWHKARLEELGYPKEVVLELSRAREHMFPKRYREEAK